MTTHAVAASSCPHCGLAYSAATEVHGTVARAPAPGDVSICWGCHGVCIYLGAEFAMRKATNEEVERLRKMPGFRAALMALDSAPTPQDAARRARDVS